MNAPLHERLAEANDHLIGGAKRHAAIKEAVEVLANIDVEKVRYVFDELLPRALKYHTIGPGYIEEMNRELTVALSDQRTP